MTPDLDEMLRAYLEREERDPLRARLQHLTDWQTEHEQKDQERHTAVIETLDAHHYRIQTLEHEAARKAAEGVTARMSVQHQSLQSDRDSSLDLAEYVGREVAQRVEAETANPSTPPPDAQKVATISRDVMAAAIAALKAEQWDRLEKERKDADEDRRALELTTAKAKARATWAAVVGGVGALGSLLAYLIEHFAR